METKPLLRGNGNTTTSEGMLRIVDCLPVRLLCCGFFFVVFIVILIPNLVLLTANLVWVRSHHPYEDYVRPPFSLEASRANTVQIEEYEVFVNKSNEKLVINGTFDPLPLPFQDRFLYFVIRVLNMSASPSVRLNYLIGNYNFLPNGKQYCNFAFDLGNPYAYGYGNTCSDVANGSQCNLLLKYEHIGKVEMNYGLELSFGTEFIEDPGCITFRNLTTTSIILFTSYWVVNIVLTSIYTLLILLVTVGICLYYSIQCFKRKRNWKNKNNLFLNTIIFCQLLIVVFWEEPFAQIIRVLNGIKEMELRMCSNKSIITQYYNWETSNSNNTNYRLLFSREFLDFGVTEVELRTLVNPLYFWMNDIHEIILGTSLSFPPLYLMFVIVNAYKFDWIITSMCFHFYMVFIPVLCFVCNVVHIIFWWFVQTTETIYSIIPQFLPYRINNMPVVRAGIICVFFVLFVIWCGTVLFSKKGIRKLRTNKSYYLREFFILCTLNFNALIFGISTFVMSFFPQCQIDYQLDNMGGPIEHVLYPVGSSYCQFRKFVYWIYFSVQILVIFLLLAYGSEKKQIKEKQSLKPADKRYAPIQRNTFFKRQVNDNLELIYEGEVDSDTKKWHGKGIVYFSKQKNVSINETDFDRDRKQYEGCFSFGKRRGVGTEYDRNGEIIEKGYWKHDKIIFRERDYIVVPRLNIPKQNFCRANYLDKGTFGKVYRVKYQNEDIVVKLYFEEYVQSSIITTDYAMDEAKFCMSFVHPNIVECKGIVDDIPNGVLGLVFEYCENGNLVERIRREPSVSFGKKIKWLYEIAKGMKRLNTFETVHRDLKLQNFLVTKDDVCKIADFGGTRVMRELRDKTIDPRTVTASPYYVAPEIEKIREVNENAGKIKYGYKIDVYSYGVCMLFLIFNNDCYRVVRQWYDDVEKVIVPEYDRSKMPTDQIPALKLMNRCLHKDPNMRPHFIEICKVLKMNYRNCLKGD